jgi:hypothetical protein
MHIGIYTWPTASPTRNMIGHKGLFGASMYFPLFTCRGYPQATSHKHKGKRCTGDRMASKYRGSTTPSLHSATLPWLMFSSINNQQLQDKKILYIYYWPRNQFLTASIHYIHHIKLLLTRRQYIYIYI